MTDRCANPRCSRRAKLLASSLAKIDWTGEEEALMCVACYLAYRQGHKRHPAETRHSVRGQLSEADREAIGAEG